MPGLYFDELFIGQVLQHPIRRTITEADNVWFSAITHNPAWLHLDEEYCRTQTEYGQRLPDLRFAGTKVGQREKPGFGLNSATSTPPRKG